MRSGDVTLGSTTKPGFGTEIVRIDPRSISGADDHQAG
jgi:hypothetical protein